MLRGLIYASVGIVHYTRQQGVLSTSQAFCEIVGRRGEDILGRHMEDFTHPDDWSASKWLLTNAIRTRQPSTINKRYIRSDGSSVAVENLYQVMHSASVDDPVVVLLSRPLDALPPLRDDKFETGVGGFAGYVHDMCSQLAPMAAASGQIITSDLLRLAQKTAGEIDRPDVLADQ